jgi:sugar fermentation stimulation protein A
MRLPQPLLRGRLVSRYKRFFADVLLDDGREVTAHCPNPGAMLGLNAPGLGVWLSASDNPKRKLAFTLEMVEDTGGLVGVNTMHPNRLVAEALANDAIPELTGYASVRPEVRYGEASRVDFLLESPDRPRCWLEIKNVHLSRTPGLAEFPDCVAARSTRHLRELQTMVAAGDRAVALFVIQRTNCERFTACRDLDPAFAAALDAASAAGVEVLCYDCRLETTGIAINRAIPWIAHPAGAPAC